MGVDVKTERIKFLVATFAATFEEDQALACLEQLRAEGAFNSGLKQLWISLEDHQAKISLLMHAVMYAQERVVAWLLANTHFDIDLGATESANPDLEGRSPLMQACRLANEPLVEILIGKGANLLHRSANGGSVFAEIQSEAMFRVLMTAAQERNCLAELFRPHVLFAFYQQKLVQCAALFQQELKKLNLPFVQYFLQLAHSEGYVAENNAEFNNFCKELETQMAAGIKALKEQFVLSLRSGADDRALIVMQQLVALGVTSNAEFSFLRLALENNRERIVAGLLNTVDDIKEAAALINSAAVFGVVTLAAQQKGCLAELFNYRRLNDFCKSNFLACMQELANNLGENPDWKPLRDVLHIARKFYLEQGGMGLDEFCESLRQRLVNAPNKPGIAELQLSSRQKHTHELYAAVGMGMFEGAVRNFLGPIGQAMNLLDNPDLCLDYLQELEELFKEFCQYEYEQVPQLDLDQLRAGEINGLFCLLPSEEYQEMQQADALRKFLLTFFEKYGLSPSDFLSESHQTAGVFSSELARMLQIAVLVLGVGERRIQLREELDGLKGFLNALKAVAPAIYDAQPEGQLTFRNPQHLSSMMMNSLDHGLTAISDFVANDFCQQFLDLYRKYKGRPELGNFTLAEFVQMLDDLNLGMFSFESRHQQEVAARSGFFAELARRDRSAAEAEQAAEQVASKGCCVLM